MLYSSSDSLNLKTESGSGGGCDDGKDLKHSQFVKQQMQTSTQSQLYSMLNNQVSLQGSHQRLKGRHPTYRLEAFDHSANYDEAFFDALTSGGTSSSQTPHSGNNQVMIQISSNNNSS